jgi:hypothetical protein
MIINNMNMTRKTPLSDHRVPREWQTLLYLDPQRLLIGLREIALTLPLDTLRYHAASLRTHDLRKFGEGRQAALFCYAMSKVIGSPVSFAQAESRDHDIVVRYAASGQLNFVPIQLKEWVPDSLNPSATLQDELNKLTKYTEGDDLVVAFYLNRDVNLRLSELNFPHGKVAELWFYGATEPSQTKWVVVGNLLSPEAKAYEFTYPST